MRRLASLIQSEFLLVVLATALPVWLASAVLLYGAQIEARALVERDAGAAAGAVMVAIDRDLAAATALAHTLATSQSLLAGDLPRFYTRAVTAIQRSGIGNNVVLSDAAGRQMLNTLQPLGQPLPRHGDPDLVQQVFATAEPVISNLYVGGLVRRPVLSVDVPVVLDGTVIYDLAIGLLPERESDILRQQHLPAGWIAGVFDRTGTIMARSQDEARFIGQKGTTAFVQAIAQAPVGLTTGGRTLEGIDVSFAWARSNLSGWTVSVAVPTDELTRRLWRSLGLSVVCTVALILTSLIMAAVVGRRLETRTVERTAARVAQHAAEEEARARSSFFAHLSHEVRTPLMAVLGCSEMIATRSHDDPRLLEYCERIDRGVNHIIAIIEQILSFARYEAGELKLHKEPLDVAAEVHSSVNLLEGTAKQAGLLLQCQVEPRMSPLNADRTQLQQILLNLLSNAIKFTPRGGTVTVSAEQVGPDCVIRVTDTGIGMSAEDLPRIMQPFGQVKSAQTGMGTGLGLPLSKVLVEQHGGSMVLTSAPGAGTTATVRLPSLLRS